MNLMTYKAPPFFLEGYSLCEQLLIVITNELQPALRGAVALAESASPRMPTDQPWCAIQTSGWIDSKTLQDTVAGGVDSRAVKNRRHQSWNRGILTK